MNTEDLYKLLQEKTYRANVSEESHDSLASWALEESSNHPEPHDSSLPLFAFTYFLELCYEEGPTSATYIAGDYSNLIRDIYQALNGTKPYSGYLSIKREYPKANKLFDEVENQGRPLDEVIGELAAAENTGDTICDTALKILLKEMKQGQPSTADGSSYKEKVKAIVGGFSGLKISFELMGCSTKLTSVTGW